MVGCIICDSSSVCLGCEGSYSLSVSQCSEIELTAVATYEELKFTSAYVDSLTLSHTLWIKGSTFQHTNLDLSVNTNISYLSGQGVITYLTISRYEWSSDLHRIIFYTNNPFNFESEGSGYNSMALLNVRRIQEEQKKYMRLMQTSNFDINADFMLEMSDSTVYAILSNPTHGGDLQMSYNINSPEFIASTLHLRQYYYHFFGWGAALFLLVFYFLKGVVLDPEGPDKGQLIPHILLLKTPVLAVFPVYAELIDYCRGFMVADLPFLDATFAALLSDPLDASPDPYRVFYASLSVSSTYLLALIAVAALAVVLGLTAYLSEGCRPALGNCALFLLNFFYGGLAFASIVCVQGAFLNLAEEFTVVSSFYLLGIVIFVALLG
jgi:hypothetical protein